MASNRPTVEHLIPLMNTRDERPTHLFHPDIEWHWAAAIPGTSVYHGHEKLVAGLVRRWWMSATPTRRDAGWWRATGRARQTRTESA